MSKTEKCGICGEPATVGPMAGGPIAWYCEDCHTKIRKFLRALEKHNKLLHKKSTDSLFRIAVTCIICRITPELGREYLILQRSSKEVHGKDMWTVAGGTIEEQDWKEVKSEYNFPLWYDVAIRALKREVKEETGLIIGNPEYLCDCVFIHKSGVPEIVLSFFVTIFGGEFKLSKEHVDYAWVHIEDLDKYNILTDIPLEIKEVDKKIMERINKIITGN